MSDLSIEEALYQDSYEWMENNAPILLESLRYEVLDKNVSPGRAKLRVLRVVGPERSGIAERVYQAAMWLKMETQ